MIINMYHMSISIWYTHSFSALLKPINQSALIPTVTQNIVAVLNIIFHSKTHCTYEFCGVWYEL